MCDVRPDPRIMVLGAVFSYRAFINPHSEDGLLGKLTGLYVAGLFFSPVVFDWFAIRIRYHQRLRDLGLAKARYEVLLERRAADTARSADLED